MLCSSFDSKDLLLLDLIVFFLLKVNISFFFNFKSNNYINIRYILASAEEMKKELEAAKEESAKANEQAEKANAVKLEVELAQWNLEEKIKACYLGFIHIF